MGAAENWGPSSQLVPGPSSLLGQGKKEWSQLAAAQYSVGIK